MYFKDVRSRFLLVSAGWIAAIAPDRSAEDIVGKTDFDFFSKEHAEAAFEDEQRIIRTGEPMVNKLERESFGNGMSPWVSTTKMPLRDETGQIIGTFGISRDVTAQIRAESALAYQVQHDPVTGLANRVALMDRLSQAVADLERQPGRLAVLYVDLDHFKAINDAFGHDAGDQVLAEVGHRLAQFSRHSDTVARLGGDEFVVLCGDLRDDDDVGLIGERIVQGIRAPFVDNGRDLSVTCSVGIVITRDPLAEPRHLIRDAEMMYEAKETGRNQYRIFDASERIGTLASRLQAELSRAIDRAELFLLYQPLFSLDDQSLLGVEALVRWHHPERGLVTPDSFIPFAEQHGLIGRIDSFVLDEACRQLFEWSSPRRLAQRFHHGRERVRCRTLGPRVRATCFRSDPSPRRRSGTALPRDDRDGVRRRMGRCPRDVVIPVTARRAPGPRRLRHGLFVACAPAANEGRHLEDRPELRSPDRSQPT